MANWWENQSFLPGTWGDISTGARSYNQPSQGGMDFLNPNGSGYFLPYQQGAGTFTGQGMTPGLGGAPGMQSQTGTGMDPYYGYGYLFGAPPTGQGTNTPNALSALGQPGAGGSALAAMAPQQQTPPTGIMNRQQAPQQAPWNPNIGPVAGPPGPATTQGGVTYSPVGSQEQLLDRIFRGAVTGQGGGPIGKMLSSFASGQLPPALAEQIAAGTDEQFGKMGARFGTDLGTAVSRGLAQASESQSMDAIKSILGLGGTTAGFQFSRGESALQRAMQEYIANQQNQTSTLDTILPLLLGGIGG